MTFDLNNNSVIDNEIVNNEIVNDEIVNDDEIVTRFRKLTKDEIVAQKRNRPTKAKITDSQIATVLKLRQNRVTFMKIDEIVFGLRNSHGNYSFRVCKNYTLTNS